MTLLSKSFLGAAAACLMAGPVHAYDVVATPENLFLPPHGDEGCWVSFFGGETFGKPSVQLAGRTYVDTFENRREPVVAPALKHVGGPAFFKRARSLVTGPNAELIGYEEEHFRHEVLTIGPGRRVVDLDAIGFGERVRSLKVLCE